MIQNNKIFIHVKGVGFTILLDKRLKHNFISPAFLAFLNLGKRQMSYLSDSMGKVNTEPFYDSFLPFLPDYVNSIDFGDAYHYVGKKIGICRDNKLKMCKIFMLEFMYKGHIFSFPFLLDKNLEVPAILGRESFNHIIKTDMK